MNMKIKGGALFLFSLGLLASSACHAPTKASDALAPVLSAVSSSGAIQAPVLEQSSLEQALDSITERGIMADLTFLASDELAGRDSPSQGLRVAARYLRARSLRMGLVPGAKDGWFHNYPLEHLSLDSKATHLVVTHAGEQATLGFGDDYFFSSRGLRNFELEVPLVYAGGGTKEELEGLNLSGKLALVEPNEETPTWRIPNTLSSKAAAGVVIMPNLAGEVPMELYRERWVQSMEQGRIGWPSADSPPRKPLFSSLYLRSAGAEKLRALGLLQGELEIGAELDAIAAETRAVMSGGPEQLENVCAFWPGTDLAQEVILMSAHYDHVGVDSDGNIYNGADDNGSGTATLLAVAEALTKTGPLRRSVLFVWVSAEEKGLLGSRAWSENPFVPDVNGMPAQVVANINIDMVGRNASDELLITPTEEHSKYNGLTRLAERVRAAEGFKPLGNADAYYNRSDQANFEKNLAIPVCFLFSDVHEDYHKPGDTVDKIDGDKIRRVSRVVLRMLDGLQADELML